MKLSLNQEYSSKLLKTKDLTNLGINYLLNEAIEMVYQKYASYDNPWNTGNNKQEVLDDHTREHNTQRSN